MSGVRYKNCEDELFKVGMYLRLSQEDKFKKESESNSIDSQRKVIKNYIDSSEDLVLIDEYADDGYTGTNFNRPSFQRMLEDIQNKRINTIIVKDLSRFGRNYIEVGKFLETTFPTMNIRFISIIDKIDSYQNPESSSSMLVNFKNLINDEYSRDISRKVKSVYTMKQKRGEYISSGVPFGYKRDENNKHHLVIDEEAAKVVRLIFELAMNGNGANKIAQYLNERKILLPSQYKKKKGMGYKTYNVNEDNIDDLSWKISSVTNILRNEVYVGTTVQNKSNKVSYKINKHIGVSKDKWIKVENTHEAIVSKEQFDWIQEKYYSKIIAVKNNYEYALFSGFLECSDCHRGFSFCTRKRKNGDIYNFYQCGNYRLNKTFCTPHTICERKIKDVVIKTINKQIKLVQNMKYNLEEININKKDSIKIEVLNNRKNEIEKDIAEKMKFKQALYTDWKEEIITFEDYKNYTRNYNSKIEELRDTLNIINNEIEEYENIPDSNTKMIDLFSNANPIKELDRDILFRMIDKIIVYDKNKIEIVFKYDDIYTSIKNYIKNKKEFLHN